MQYSDEDEWDLHDVAYLIADEKEFLCINLHKVHNLTWAEILVGCRRNPRILLVDEGNDGVGRTSPSQHIEVAHVLHENVIEKLSATKSTSIDHTWPHIQPSKLFAILAIFDKRCEFHNEERRRKAESGDEKTQK